MNFRVVLPLCAVLVFGCAHTPQTQSAQADDSFRGPASTGNFTEQQLTQHLNCNSRTLSATEKLLVKLFAKHRDSIVKLCVEDPLTPKYFPDDNNPDSVQSRVAAFCQYNPALRICILCNFEHSGKKTTLAENFEACQNLLLNSESAEHFRADVLSPHDH